MSFIDSMMMGGGKFDALFSKVSLLLHFEGTLGDNVVQDNGPQQRFLRAVNGGVISNGAAKFGATSFFFDGTGDYVTDDDLRLDVGPDFTIEFWMNKSAQVGTASNYIIDFRHASGDIEPAIAINGSGQLEFYSANALKFTHPTVLTNGQWYHVALTRSGGSLYRAFLNGSYSAYWVDDSVSGLAVLTLGTAVTARGTGTANHYTGYLDEVRITNGYSRYITTFTPETRQFLSGKKDPAKYDEYWKSVCLLCHFDKGNMLSQSEDFTSPTNAVSHPGWALDLLGQPTYYALTETATTGEHMSDHIMPVSSGQTLTFGFDVLSHSGRNVSIRVWDSSGQLAERLFSPSTGTWVAAGTGTLLQNSGFIFLGTINGINVYRLWITILTLNTGNHYFRFQMFNGTANSYLGDVNVNAFGGRFQLSPGTQLAKYYQTKSSAISDSSFPPLDISIAVGSDTQQIGAGALGSAGSLLSYSGLGTRLTLQNHTLLDFGTRDFTIEGNVYFNEAATGTGANNNTIVFVPGDNCNINRDSAGTVPGSVTFWDGSAQRQISPTAPTLNTWHHFAVSRVNGNVYTFWDGVLTTTFAMTGARSMAGASIAGRASATTFLGGWLDELRVTNGVGRYQGDFIVPTAPFPETDYNPDDVDYLYDAVSLLMLGDEGHGATTFKDNSKNNFTLNRGGDAIVHEYVEGYLPSRFIGHGQYYFDGTGDYIYNDDAYAFNSGYTNGTFELWQYSAGLPQDACLIDLRAATGNNAPMLVLRTTGVLELWIKNASKISTTIAFNRWNHIAASFSQGVWRLHVNGAVIGTYTSDFFGANSLGALTIGSWVDQRNTTTGGKYQGWITNIRITRGAARYFGDFNPPDFLPKRGPKSSFAIQHDPTYQSLDMCLHMDGANGSTTIVDSSRNAYTITAVGNAALSTAQAKFGGSSCLFDGNGDYLQATIDPAVVSEWFTDCWIYRTAASGHIEGIVDYRSTGTSTGAHIRLNASGQAEFWANNGIRATSAAVVPLNQWVHLAFIGTNGILRGFVDGVQQGADYAFSYGNSTTTLTIGCSVANKAANTTDKFNGYIDEVRYSGRYSPFKTNFTPPTRANPDRGSPI